MVTQHAGPVPASAVPLMPFGPTVRKPLIGLPVDDQALIDEVLIELDGTANKSEIGANAILGASMACLHAGRGIP